MSQQYVLTCSCGHRMVVREEHFGRKGKCSKCGNVICATRETMTPLPETAAQPPAPPSVARPAEADVAVEWNVGDVILDLYEVTDLLGEGGMGKVYKVHQRDWDLDLAVKVPQPDYFRTPTHKENFVRECHAWMDLGLHPHIVTCNYVRVLGGVPRVFAEYVDGGSLEDWIQDGRLYEGGAEKALERILSTAIQFAWGLHHAHEKGLIHQDVKPANVMLTSEGTVKVTDFGLANARAAAGESVAAPPGGSIMASYGGMTPAYCSPEQAENAARREAGMPREQLTKLTRGTDLYSWAVSVFEMFNGGMTWTAGNVVGHALESYLEGRPSDDDLPAMPESVAALLWGCLQQEPKARPKDMAEVAGRLTQIYKDVIGHEYPKEVPTAPAEVADILNNKALSFLELGNEAEAERLWQEALKLDAHHPETIYSWNLYAWRSARIADDEVVRRVEVMRTSHVAEWRDEYLLGLVHLERQDKEGACRVLAKAATMSGNARGVMAALEHAQALGPSCRRTFEGHMNSVESVCLGNDGRWALSGGWDKTVRLWEVATGRCLRTFEGHTGVVSSVCLSADGRWALSSGGGDRTARLWEVATGQCLRTFEEHMESVDCACLSGDGRWVLCAGRTYEDADWGLRLWDVAADHRVRTLEGHTAGVNSVCMSRDGHWALSGSRDDSVRLWDVATGRCLRTFEGHTGGVSSVCLSEDGRCALSGSRDWGLKLWEVATGRCLRVYEGHMGPVTSVCLSTDVLWALSGGEDNTVRLWDVATGRCVRTFQGHTGHVNSVCLSRDGRWALSGSGDETLRLWDLYRVEFRSRLSPPILAKPEVVQALQEHEDENRLRLAEAREAARSGNIERALERVRVARAVPGWNYGPAGLEAWAELGLNCRRAGLLGARQVRMFTGHTKAVVCACLDRSGRLALSGSEDETLRLWEVPTGRCLRTFEGHTSYVKSACFSADSCWALSGSSDRTARLWEVATGQCLRTFEEYRKSSESSRPIRLSANRICLSPDGHWALSETEDALRLWDIATGRTLRIFEGHTGPVWSSTFSADGRLVLSGSHDNMLWLWEVATGRCVRTFEGHIDSVQCVSLSADGRWAVSGSEDNTLRLWEVATGRCVRTFEGHIDSVQCVSLSADGRWALSGSVDNSLQLWEVATGRCIQTLAGHTDSVWSVCLSADGRRAFSGSNDRTARIWELDWELEFPGWANWNEGARPFLSTFLTLHTPYAAALPQDHEPSEAEITRALTREGRPTWTDADFKQLLHTLGCAGYGWLRPEGVKRELERMAAKWEGPPPIGPCPDSDLGVRPQSSAGIPAQQAASVMSSFHQEVLSPSGSRNSSVQDLTNRGMALLNLGREDEGLNALQQAVAGGAIDALTLSTLRSRLQSKPYSQVARRVLKQLRFYFQMPIGRLKVAAFCIAVALMIAASSAPGVDKTIATIFAMLLLWDAISNQLTMKIYDRHTAIMFAVSVLLAIWFWSMRPAAGVDVVVFTVSGLLLGPGLLYAIDWCSRRFLGKPGMGMGTIKMCAATVPIAGSRIIMVIMVFSLVGSFLGLGVLLLRYVQARVRQARGVYVAQTEIGSSYIPTSWPMLWAYLIVFLYGGQLVRSYLRWMTASGEVQQETLERILHLFQYTQ